MSELSHGIAQVVAGLVKGGMKASASPKKTRPKKLTPSSSNSKPKSKPKSNSGIAMPDEEKTNAAMTAGRGKDLGHGLITMSGIPEDQQHLYREWHGRIYHIGSLSPEVLRRMDGDGVKCELGMKIGGRFKSMRFEEGE